VEQGRTNLKRYLPHVLIATFVVAVLPLLILFSIRASGHLGSPLLSMALAVLLSIATATAGSACWMRHPGSKDLVFGDLMIWGWIRQLRAEKRLGQAAELLGIGGSGARRQEAGLAPERQAEILEQLAGALEARDTYTHGHTRRVTRHAQRIAERMGLPRDRVAKVRAAAAVHDERKIKVPREVLNKPDKLSDEEFALMKRHPEDGAQMVTAIGDSEITAMVRHHHERLDGTGYPDGLSAGNVPLGARIIAVADTFDAMTSTRPYRAACRHKKAIEILKKEAGSQLDPDAVRAFLGYYSGRRSLALWALLTEGPQRLLSWLGGAFQGASAAPLAKGAAVVATTAALGGSVVSPPAPLQMQAGVYPGRAMAGQLAEGSGNQIDRLSSGEGEAADGQPGLRPALKPGSRSEPGFGRRPTSASPSGPGSLRAQPGPGPRPEGGPAPDSASDPATVPASGPGPGSGSVPESGRGGTAGSGPSITPDSGAGSAPAPKVDSAPSSGSVVDTQPTPSSGPSPAPTSGSGSGSGSSGSGSGSSGSGSGSGSSGSGSRSGSNSGSG
jgi:hypothetical protein